MQKGGGWSLGEQIAHRTPHRSSLNRRRTMASLDFPTNAGYPPTSQAGGLCGTSLRLEAIEPLP
jgi:hypothetical protein